VGIEQNLLVHSLRGHEHEPLVMNNLSKHVFYGFFSIMLSGNLLWLVTLHVVGSALDVSWIEVEHTLRPFAFVSLREMMKRNGRSEEYIKEREKNIDWGGR
jgi:hypothetical protein